MQRRHLKIVLALLLGWYFVGPLVETVDRWDSARSETADIARSACGVMTFAIGGVAVAMALLRQLKARCAVLSRAVQGTLELSFPLWLPAVVAELSSASHSPPLPLRV